MMWAGGIYAHLLLGGPPEGMAWTATAFLGLAGLLMLSSLGARTAGWFFLAGMIGFGAELIGVHTGLPFGVYAYTVSLPPLLWGVPVIMVFAWLILTAYICHMLGRWMLSRWCFILLAALWMVGLDLVIDPLAAGPLDYWRWAEKGWYAGIPLTNFIGWFIISICVFAALPEGYYPQRVIGWTGLSIIVFFTILAFIYGFYLAGGIGMLLTGLHFGGMYMKPYNTEMIG